MTAISKNVYIDVLDDIVNRYNNTTHRTIKTKPIDVTNNSFAEYNEEFDSRFKAGDYEKISKDKKIFAKGYAPNWLEEVFVINKINNTVPWTYVISDLNGEEITGSFYKKELQSTNQQKYRIEKIIKRKDDVKWKGYNGSFNSWINKKDIL